MVLWAATSTEHTYFGPLTDADTHDPTIDDHVAGTAGEFGMNAPLGDDQAAPHETFVKIGVGELRRVDDRPYFFRRAYPLVDPGTWRIQSTPTTLTMTHKLATDAGWTYRYDTVIELIADRPGFTIERTLTNRGTRRIETSHYGHHFVILDGVPLDPGYRLDLNRPYRIGPNATPGQRATFDGTTLDITEPMGNASLWLPLSPDERVTHDNTPPAPWQARFSHTTTQARLTMIQTPMPNRVVLYAKSPYVSVEPFIDIDLAPGESVTWRAVYLMH